MVGVWWSPFISNGIRHIPRPDGSSWATLHRGRGYLGTICKPAGTEVHSTAIAPAGTKVYSTVMAPANMQISTGATWEPAGTEVAMLITTPAMLANNINNVIVVVDASNAVMLAFTEDNNNDNNNNTVGCLPGDDILIDCYSLDRAQNTHSCPQGSRDGHVVHASNNNNSNKNSTIILI